MEIFPAIISILIISGIVHGANKILRLRICPICAGVAGTWLLLLFLRFFGYPIPTPIIAMLIGGSIVGIAYQIEKRLPEWRSTLLFKMIFVPVGFFAAYEIIEWNWMAALAAIVALAITSFAFLTRTSKPDDAKIAELKKKMDECC